MSIVKSDMKNEIFEGKGFDTSLFIELEDLAQIRNLIRDNILRYVSPYLPEGNLNFFDTNSCDYYHHLSPILDPLIPHNELWKKWHRIFNEKEIDLIKKMSFFCKLQDNFGPIRIANEEAKHSEEIYWRLVRPFKKSDVGPIHADKWFWDLGHGVMPEGYQRVKIWVPIYCEKGGNGLKVVSFSQFKNFEYSSEIRSGILKPTFDESKYELDITHLDLIPGQCVVFHDELLHGGCINKSNKTRISLEFTMLIKDN